MPKHTTALKVHEREAFYFEGGENDLDALREFIDDVSLGTVSVGVNSTQSVAFLVLADGNYVSVRTGDWLVVSHNGDGNLGVYSDEQFRHLFQVVS